MKTLYIGCDVSKKAFEVTLRANDIDKNVGEFQTNAKGYDELHKAMNKYVKKGYQCHLIAEPTGTYHLGLITYAYEQEWDVSLPNPALVRQWAKGQGTRVKTDKIDSHTLATYGLKEEPAPENSLPEHVEELNLMLKRKDDIEKSLLQERNRLESLDHRPLPHESIRLSILDAIAFYDGQLIAVEQNIKSHLRTHEDLAEMQKFLLTVPGIGDKSVLKIMVFLFRLEARTSSTGDATGLVAFVGLDPVAHTSGTSVYRRPSISKMGDGEMRRTLYMCSLGGMRAKSSPLVDFYQRLLSREKPKKVALVAGARKILVWAFAVFRSGGPFDPAKAMPKSV